jgi:cytidyltransferase-like protein
VRTSRRWAGDRTRIVRGDAQAWAGALRAGAFDLALSDPPYDGGYLERLLELFRRVPLRRRTLDRAPERGRVPPELPGLLHVATATPPSPESRPPNDASDDPRIALYPGSFDPVTLGHEDIARRTLRVADRVIVAVAHSSQGRKPLRAFTVEERLDHAPEVFADEPRIRA